MGATEAAEDFAGRLDVDVLEGRKPGTVVVTVTGELDHDTAAPLKEALVRHARAGRIVVDCAGLRFCDSTGLNVLLRARLRMLDAGGRLDLAALRAPVNRMFEITGARAVFRVYEDTAAALADTPATGGASAEGSPATNGSPAAEGS
ncbi:STAS domain-containing protein [Streptomyces roseoviridis]|uniref:Anti-sigma factor antagonist n=1 Tax=Streptomyces roseoviridis TaxID=67361 RepID=A0ABV5QT60_9ACTN